MPGVSGQPQRHVLGMRAQVLLWVRGQDADLLLWGPGPGGKAHAISGVGVVAHVMGMHTGIHTYLYGSQLEGYQTDID